MTRFTASAIRRRLGTRAALVALAVGTAVFAVQSPSMADDTYFTFCSTSAVSCQTGVEVSGPSGHDACVTATATNTRVCIDYAADVVFVTDGRADGNSGLAMVRATAGVAERWCRNPHGNGTWARCDFDWSETAGKTVFGGIRLTTLRFDVAQLWTFTNN